MPPSSATVASAVVLSYEALLRGDDLSEKIEEAFGVDGIGILTVSGVPELAEVRDRLLPLANEFAALPGDVKSKYETPEAFYSRGWSHGREKLQGRPDVAKGSYYANPLANAPFAHDPKAVEAHPTFCAPNLWPDEVPELENAFMTAGQLVHRVGLLVAAQCDRYVRSKCTSYAPKTHLEEIIRTSRVCCGRLLYYFPMVDPMAASDGVEGEGGKAVDTAEDTAFSSWCGWHNDHGSLTGLIPGMFFDHRQGCSEGADGTADAAAASDAAAADAANGSGSEDSGVEADGSSSSDGRRLRGRRNESVSSLASSTTQFSPSVMAAPIALAASPDPTAGLHVRSRKGELVRVPMPTNHLAFQIGETAQVHSGGLLQATPHAVRGCSVPGISRATFAVFMEPEWHVSMAAPDGIDPKATQSSAAASFLPKGVPPLHSRWGTEECPFTTCNFGDFSTETFKRYH